MPETEAVTESLRQMGDPVLVGTELDRVHRAKPQWGLLLFVAVLVLAGAVWRVWLTDGWPHGAQQTMARTALEMVIGLGWLLGAYFLDYTFLGRHPYLCYGGALAAGLLLLAVSPSSNYKSYYTQYLLLTQALLSLATTLGYPLLGVTFPLLGGNCFIIVNLFLRPAAVRAPDRALAVPGGGNPERGQAAAVFLAGRRARHRPGTKRLCSIKRKAADAKSASAAFALCCHASNSPRITMPATTVAMAR